VTRATTISAFIVLVAVAASSQSVERPIALDWHEGGNLFVLDDAGRVAVYDVKQKRRIRVFVLERSIRPADIVSAKIFNTETVFVSGSYGRQSVVLQYSPEGVLLNRFDTPDLAAGMDIDPSTHILYLASPVSRKIYSVSLEGKERRVRFLSYVGLAKTIGPLAFDQPRRRLLAGDVQSGALYAVDIRNGEYKLIANGLGSPVALAFDKTFSILYVADYSNGRIQSLKLPAATAATAWKTSMRDLSGVAPSSMPDSIFITDEKQGVFLLSIRTGQKSSIANW